ncbi:adenosine deaminase domain-containing protein 1, partial [Lingula anatina]|uniref:Adenosine deaminase domain-containing protein 1 n=1 Tax=Lingula anatina TaxID=7574 RepID=A0A2R2MLP6_LINAN
TPQVVQNVQQQQQNLDSAFLKRKSPKKVPPELIQAFTNGTKNPVSALMEYCSMTRMTAVFEEAAVETPSIVAKFANVCKIDGRPFPQGVGKTKKEAKVNAAKIAFTAMLGMEEEDIEDESETGRVMYDVMGRKLMLPKEEFPVEETIDSENAPYDAGSQPVAYGRNPVGELQEYCVKKRIPFLIEISDTPGPKGFVATVTVDDEPFATATGPSKKDAKRQAADAALSLLLKFDEPEEVEAELTHYDKMASMSHQQLHKLTASLPELEEGNKVVAAFVVKRGEADSGQVVALGTGSLSITGEQLSADGRTVNDSHAEIIARRALVRYFHRELKSFYEGNTVHSIFEERYKGAPLLTLKDYITIHLYISTAPCGDAALFSARSGTPPPLSHEEWELIQSGAHYPTFETSDHGVARTKIEGGEGTIPTEKDQLTTQTWDGIKSGQQRLRSMSCSDKILKWNVLGLQGALFSNFLEPVYVSSVTLGNLYDHGHATRAFCCRLEGIIRDLPEGYCVNHPYIGRTTHCQTLRHANPKMSILSTNWCQGDEKVEIIDARSGKEIPSSPFKTGATLASRMCKAGFFHRYKEIAKMAKKHHLLKVNTYRDAKLSAQSYQQAKQVFYHYLQAGGWGSWVVKPPEQELFTK